MTLTVEQADAFGGELDALRAELVLGQEDVDHIRRIIALARRSELAGRMLLALGLDPLTFVAGAGLLSLAKILENMEIGHNVMHGQYDWTRDPQLHSHDYDWDMACDADHWRHSHNYEHHTFTNILGKDRDVGYGWLRFFPEQPWRPAHLAQLLVAAGLALGFEWGIGAHDLRVPETLAGEQSTAELARRAGPFLRKVAWQLLKDYGVYPVLAGPNFARVAFGNLLANATRNVWAFAVIFCGHFPEGVVVYDEATTRTETRGQWLVRQLQGSANLEGSPVFDLLTGHLSYQIEHHLFPDVPASRYPELAPRVREICARHAVSYQSGSLRKQLGSVARRLLRYSLPF
ncbi:MAG: acyl-CoA desaturase [Polyangia bacterium]